jgi:protein-disulfide isomerase
MSDTPQAMSIPAAIVIAGVLIAGAVYFSQVGPKEVPAPASTQATPEPASLDIRPITNEDHVRGPENAKITILEYSDLECPFCKVFHQSMVQLLQDYPNDVRWVYRHAPIESNHKQAFAEENASECAAVQGKFWEFTDVIFENTTSNDGLDLSQLPKYAQEAGVTNIAAFEKCVAEDTYRSKVQADLDDGIKAGLAGTPFNMVITADGNKSQLGGGLGYPQLKAIIEPLL